MSHIKRNNCSLTLSTFLLLLLAATKAQAQEVTFWEKANQILTKRADVDLLATNGGDARPCVSTYTFTAKTTDYENRFKLVFAADSNSEDADGDNAFAFISNGNIIVNGEGTLQVIDVTGRVVRCADVARNVSTNEMTAGVYVLRLINGENVKTQKVVIN